MISGITVQQLQCFEAVVAEGSFQAAAKRLHRSQPTVSSSVMNLENLLGLELLDRSGYRVSLTADGHSFYQRARVLLSEFDSLNQHARQLACGEESQLNVVLGDVCPLSYTLGLLRDFFSDCPGTRLHLHFEAIAGPWERLFSGEANLILHHVDQTDTRLEYIALQRVDFIPVVARDFLRFAITDSITPEQMRDYVQCIIRDTAQHSHPRNYYLVEGARSCTVTDQLTKKELIMQGMGWGHLPSHLIQAELDNGSLLAINGKYFQGGYVNMVAARLRHAVHGPVAERLWQFIKEVHDIDLSIE